LLFAVEFYRANSRFGYKIRWQGRIMNASAGRNSVPAPDDPSFFDLLAGSYARLLNRPLGADSAAWLYHQAPFVVLAHNTDPDPRFIYANKAAQTCFGYSWDEFVGLPSRLSAEEILREKRQAVLEKVARDGFIAGYSGVRIAKSGRRFGISGAVIWQLIDEAGAIHGQAAAFSRWSDVEL
jgi:PAS domain S-box-containing protein